MQRLLETDILSGNIKEIPREGSMLPETYRFTRGTPRDQVIQRMQQAQRRVVQDDLGPPHARTCRCARPSNW